ncbi:unnamed protein product, partial [Scytosiphon promiscuus]
YAAPPLPPPFSASAPSNADQGQFYHEQGWSAAGGYQAPPLPPPPGQTLVHGQGNMGGQMGSQVNGSQMPDQMGHYAGGPINGPMGGHMGGMVANSTHAMAPVASAPLPGTAGGIDPGGMSGAAGMNVSMMGGIPPGMGVGVGGFPAGPAAAQQRPAKKVPDWLVQTLKEKEKLAEKQKKREGVSLSTDVAAALPGGAGNISGYNLVHSPSPSPPDSPSAQRTKPSWQEEDSDDDSADEVSPTRANEERKRSSSNGNATAGGDGGSGVARNGTKPSSILKKGGTKTRGGTRAGGGVDESEAAEEAAVSGVMDEETRASFDREIRRLLTQLLQVGTANIIREEAVLQQKKAIGALIGGYGSASESESEGDASPPQAAAPSATVSSDAGKAVTAAVAVGGGAPGDTARSLASAQKRAPVMVGGKWPLPAWADPPHEAPLPEGLSILVETIGPDLERVKIQELSFSTTVMGRFEEQCGFVVEDSSASRCHAAILAAENNVYVVDIFSANGTAVNGKKIQPGVRHPLTTGGVLTLGTRNQSFRVIVRSAPPPRKQPPAVSSVNVVGLASSGAGSAKPPVSDTPPKPKAQPNLVALAAEIAARINTKTAAATVDAPTVGREEKATGDIKQKNASTTAAKGAEKEKPSTHRSHSRSPPSTKRRDKSKERGATGGDRAKDGREQRGRKRNRSEASLPSRNYVEAPFEVPINRRNGKRDGSKERRSKRGSPSRSRERRDNGARKDREGGSKRRESDRRSGRAGGRGSDRVGREGAASRSRSRSRAREDRSKDRSSRGKKTIPGSGTKKEENGKKDGKEEKGKGTSRGGSRPDKASAAASATGSQKAASKGTKSANDRPKDSKGGGAKDRREGPKDVKGGATTAKKNAEGSREKGKSMPSGSSKAAASEQDAVAKKPAGKSGRDKKGGSREKTNGTGRDEKGSHSSRERGGSKSGESRRRRSRSRSPSGKRSERRKKSRSPSREEKRGGSARKGRRRSRS